MRVFYLLLLVAPVAFADDAGDRAKLMGTWQTQEGPSGGVTWTLEKAQDAIKITESQNGQKISEVLCNTSGKDCEVNSNGHKATISMYYNGPNLVEFETRGSEVIKRKFSIASPDDVLEVEVVPVVPGGKTETLRYRRLAVAGR